MAEINYDAIKTEYLTSDASFASLAKKYGINHSSISRKAKKEKWDEEKARMRTIAHKAVQEKTIETQLSLADKCLSILNIMVDKVTESAQICEPGDTRTQKDIMSMIKDLNEMGAFELQSGSSEDNTLTVRFEVDEYAD